MDHTPLLEHRMGAAWQNLLIWVHAFAWPLVGAAGLAVLLASREGAPGRTARRAFLASYAVLLASGVIVSLTKRVEAGWWGSLPGIAPPRVAFFGQIIGLSAIEALLTFASAARASEPSFGRLRPAVGGLLLLYGLFVVATTPIYAPGEPLALLGNLEFYAVFAIHATLSLAVRAGLGGAPLPPDLRDAEWRRGLACALAIWFTSTTWAIEQRLRGLGPESPIGSALMGLAPVATLPFLLASLRAYRAARGATAPDPGLARPAEVG